MFKKRTSPSCLQSATALFLLELFLARLLLALFANQASEAIPKSNKKRIKLSRK